MAIDISKLTPKQLEALSSKIDARKGEMRKKAIADLRKRINDMIKSEGFTPDEVFGKRSKRRTTKVAAKYRNPADTAQTWSGRGKRPRWFNAALKAGKKEADLLIK